MNPNLIGIVSRQRYIHAASTALLGMVLALFALPCLLSAQTLQHRYSFVSDASDSVGGSAWDGNIQGPTTGTSASISNGLVLAGGSGPGVSGYVTLPAGILNTTTNITIECWATQSSQDGWAELWNFNNGTGQYFGYIPYPANNNNNMSLADKNGNEYDALSSVQFPNGVEEHITAVYNVTNLTASLYLGPTFLASVVTPTGYTPGTYNTANNYLGQDPFPDPQWGGTLYEFRIYNGVLSPFQILVNDAAGPTNIVTSLTPVSVSLQTSSTNLVLTGSAQGAMNITLPTTGANYVLVDADSITTNWVSSNPSVLQVSTNGVITAVGIGSGTVSATVDGMSSTSPTIFVSAPQTLLHRYSFASDASDSVGGPAWAGTLMPPNGGTNASISGGLTLPGGGTIGHSGYLLLPGGVISNTTSLTVECWATQVNGNNFAQIVNFGDIQGESVGFIPLPGRDNGNFEVGVSPNNNEIDTISSIHFPTNSEEYFAFVFNSGALSSGLYGNGNLLATQTFPNRSYIPGSISSSLGATNNVLGQDPYPDPQFQGTVYELRIWNGALPPVYVAVAAAAGPSVIVTNYVPTSLTITVTNLSMIGSQVQQASVTGNFTEASDVTVTDGATNWTSSSTSVLTVNQSGQITAVSGGTATVSATVSGVPVTSSTITVATTPPIISQYPTNQTAAVNDSVSFSFAALGGTLSYQWSFNSTPILGATNTTLAVTNVSFSSGGTYTVHISNSAGSTNISAVLTVQYAILEHRYSFATDASDSVGGPQWNGAIIAPSTNAAAAPATISNGLTLPGGGGGGFSGYVAFPSGIITNTTSITVECWVTQNTANQWATVWDFANNGSQNFEMCPFPQRGILNLDVAIDPGTEIDTVSGSLFPSGTQVYTAFTYNAGTLTGNIYTNGYVGGTQLYPAPTSSLNYTPGTLGGSAGTAQNWLGNDTYGDSQFQGTIYEFRIWDGAVSPIYLELSELAGPSQVVSNTTPTSVSAAVTNYTMIQGASQTASASANFTLSGTNVNLSVTTAVTNWISGNTSVLTVNSNGVVTAVGTGSTTISATVNGVTGPSTAITVEVSAPFITQQPAASAAFLQGATLTASVSAIGTTPFVYRWFLNSGITPVSTSASPTLAIPNVQPSYAGTYTVLVSNIDGTALSSNLVVTIIAPNQYEQAVLQYGPVGYWPLQETSGSIAYDVIGGDNGTYTNFPSVAGSSVSLGQSGPSQSFFGNSSYAVQLFSAIVDIPEGQLNITGPVTVTAWIQQEAASNFGGIVGHGDTSWRTSVTENGDPGAGLAGGNDGTSAASDATAPTSVNINDDNWHMVVYTYTGNTSQANNGSLYVDGVLVASNTIPAAPAGNDLDVWIGGAPDYGTGRLLTAANLAHVAVFNQSFTAAQVQGLYNGTYVLGPQTINIAQSGKNVVLTWQTGTLLQTTNLLSPWTTNSTAVSPYTVPATNTSVFFKLLVTP